MSQCQIGPTLIASTQIRTSRLIYVGLNHSHAMDIPFFFGGRNYCAKCRHSPQKSQQFQTTIQRENVSKCTIDVRFSSERLKQSSSLSSLTIYLLQLPLVGINQPERISRKEFKQNNTLKRPSGKDFSVACLYLCHMNMMGCNLMVNQFYESCVSPGLSLND